MSTHQNFPQPPLPASSSPSQHGARFIRGRATRTIGALSVASLALGLAACGGGDEQSGGVSEAASDEEVELTLWLQRDEFAPTDSFEAFEEEHENITVNTVTIPAEEQVSSFLRSSAAGDTPDVLMPTTDLWPALAEQEGALYDMTSLLETWEEEDPEGYEAASAGIRFGTAQDGSTYGVGISGAPTWTLYRKDWFEEAGIEPPETYEELLEGAKTIKEEHPESTAFGLVGGRSASPASHFLTYFYRMGGTHENGVPQFDSEAGIALLEYYQDLVKEGLAHRDTLTWTTDQTRGTFIEGQLGTVQMSQNLYPTVEESLTYDEEWAILPDIHREGAEDDLLMTYRAVTALVAGSTEHPYEASLLVRYLAGEEYGVDLSKRYQPSLNAAVQEDEEYLDVAPWVPELADNMDAAEPLPANPNSIELYEVIQDMKQEAIDNPDADAAEIAANGQEALDAIGSE
ncbi:ABC transporter substrate-binding protein [Nesterenkonia sp. Act20]|uniref:ABC transporter substrate-binding protein n=1 Tax=Nesterenkonia sp. Act20 TaxID=1483432 RepID=UPI001C465973|nr:extracellular solute-binding protein [Nesterenkonia sp. Act20]